MWRAGTLVTVMTAERARERALVTLGLRVVPVPADAQARLWHALLLEVRALDAWRTLRRAEPDSPLLGALEAMRLDARSTHLDTWPLLTPGQQADFLCLVETGGCLHLSRAWTLTAGPYTGAVALLLLALGALAGAVWRVPDALVLGVVAGVLAALIDATAQTWRVGQAAARLGGSFRPAAPAPARLWHPTVLQLPAEYRR